MTEQHGNGSSKQNTRQTTLADAFTLSGGRVFISGTQALARLPLMQRQADMGRGLDTGGFISGYRGSPLAGYDLVLKRVSHLLDQHRISFLPAINEELAATAIIGTQQVAAQTDANCAGVFSLWYGKGPGLDRAGDALKHANSIGTTRHGGVLVAVGDDHNAISSAMAHQSEQLFSSWMMPVLHPASIGEIIEFGLLGWAMSRFSGCYVGLKMESEIIESAASVHIPDQYASITQPDFDFPKDGVHYRWPDRQLDAEARLHHYKLPAALGFAAANGIDRVVLGKPRPRFGIITTGKAYRTVRQALTELGVDEQHAVNTGLGIYKVGMSWPLETTGVCQFVSGAEEVMVVEEKRGVIESQLKEALFNLPRSRRPRVVGKTDERGAALFPSNGILSAELISRVIARRLPDIVAGQRANEHLAHIEQQKDMITLAGETRPPFFCSGCPHNRSTAAPEGSRVLAGTGCHLMAVFMNRDTSGFLHMGAEGVNWAGQAPFCKTSHMFQNLGDGTYTHSGSLAIRQAVAAGVNITYKILHNDAVAMTGGQPVDGGLTVPQVTRQLDAEGVRRIAVLSDDPGKYSPAEKFATGVSVHHRDQLQAVEKQFSAVQGVTVLIYDQLCAAEKRRRKRRSRTIPLETRLFINEAVCEGCGDCVVQSNCLSVVPVQTEFGVKRQIDQSSCNIDMSCLEGFCPSFVSISGARPAMINVQKRKQLEKAITHLPKPRLPEFKESFEMVVTGIGGQGVVTIGRIVGMAAHLQGRGCSVLDFPGLAQKGGGVMSYVRITRRTDTEQASRVPLGRADLLLASDMVTALATETIGRIGRDLTRAVVNTHVSPTGNNVLNPDSLLDTQRLKQGIIKAVGDTGPHFVNATRLSERLAGDTITANMLLLGYAWQAGTIPMDEGALMQAIELNGAGSDTNTLCFAYGRLAAHDPQLIAELAGIGPTATPVPESTLEEVIKGREQFLIDYQDKAYARRYRSLVDTARQAESGLGQDSTGFGRAVAEGFFRLMAYKDEYEVARLHTSETFSRQLFETISPGVKITHHLAPPLLSRRDRTTGKIPKLKFGPWLRPVLRLLARFRFLRGTPIDLFGYTRERRDERARIDQYERSISELCSSLSSTTLAPATAIAALASTIRGFGHIKQRNVEVAAVERERLEEQVKKLQSCTE
jgi:indolepyruvate ferredoxin oxidoreductase